MGCSYSHGSGYNPGMYGGMMPQQIQHFNKNKTKGMFNFIKNIYYFSSCCQN
jgi:hypothetical protein